MSGLQYNGLNYSSDGNSANLLTKQDVDTLLGAQSVSKTSVTAQVNAAALGLASQSSVNNALSANYVAASGDPTKPYVPTTSLLLTSKLGAKGGVATLDGAGLIPSSQIPVLGAGYVKGPYGPTMGATSPNPAVYAASDVQSSPKKIVDWNIGTTGITFQPWCFMSLFVQAKNLGRPMVEVWVNSGDPGSVYGVGSLVARGIGRSFWNDFMAVNVVPTSTVNSAVGGTGYGPNYTAWLSAWLIDLNQQGVNFYVGNLANAAVYLVKYTT